MAATLLNSRYRLEERIGAGGFCEVWRATDTVLTRPAAVKLLHPGFAYQPEARARFRAEARHAGALSHQNIARVYDYGEPARGQSYLVMELVSGPSLARVLAGSPLDAARTMDIVAQVAAGLQAAHSAGLIHRDIKPANVLLTAEGAVRITDFGIAHAVGSAPLTATGMVLGTPGYLAPERVAGAQGGPASDLYALGIVAFECLTGARPFSGPPLEVALAHRDRPLPPLPASLPAEVADFVMVLTAKDPAWRPGSAAEVADQARWLYGRLVCGAIRARPARSRAPLAIAGTPGSPARSAGWDRPADGRSRQPGLLSAAVLVALTALTCLIVFTATGLASATHPAARVSLRPPRAAPSVHQPPPTTSPVTARAAGHQPSASQNSQNSKAGTLAEVRHVPVRHRTPRPGRHHHQNRPARETSPPPQTGHGHGHGPGSRKGPGDSAGPGPENGQDTVMAAGGSVGATA